jgi:hypothetical protein
MTWKVNFNNYLLIVKYRRSFLLIHDFFNLTGLLVLMPKQVLSGVERVFDLLELRVVQNHRVIDSPVVREN